MRYTNAQIRTAIEDRFNGTVDPDIIDFVVRCKVAKPALTAEQLNDLTNHISTARLYAGHHVEQAEATILECQLPSHLHKAARRLLPPRGTPDIATHKIT